MGACSDGPCVNARQSGALGFGVAYELIFVPRMLGQSWAEAVQAAARAGELTSQALITARLEPWDALMSAIRSRLAELGTAVPQAMPTPAAQPPRHAAGLVEHRAPRHRELLHRPTGLRLSLFGAEALLSLPYWHGDAEAERALRLVVEVGRLVESVTGLVGYHPRLRRGLDELRAAELLTDYRAARDAFNAATGAAPTG